MLKKILRTLKYIAIFFVALIVAIIIYLNIVTKVTPPEVAEISIPELVEVDGKRSIGNNWLRKNEFGLWEMYVEGEPYERGRIAGELSKDLVQYQEDVFVEQILRVIPSRFYLNFLRVMIGYFNRNLNKHIPEEYLKEIYGISKSASEEYNFIGKPYSRMMNYHAAHDIGHALLDYELVEDVDLQLGCTSFSLWDEKTKNNNLISGRTFDFYFGDEFAKNVIVKFVKPDTGIPFGFITWGGMIGVVSGMNKKGLAVTVNAGKSDLPTSSSTPVTIVARDILQYASNIDEAIKIAEKYQVFVSESFMISSAYDNKTVIIEKSPKQTGIVYPDTNYILCTNHFQSEVFASDEANIKHQKETATSYRYERLKELVESKDKLTVIDVSDIIKDYKGLNNENIGIGNEKTINQFIAHHAIIFKPHENQFLVSTRPYIMGPYISYDLNKVFDGSNESISEKVIPKDEFLFSEEYIMFEEHKRLIDKINQAIYNEEILYNDTLKYFVSTNKNLYRTYMLVGDYYKRVLKNCDKAVKYYKIGLKKEIDNFAQKKAIKRRIKECKN